MIEKKFRLDDKVAIVTGATGFLGRVEAKTLADAGANLVLVDINQSECTKLANEFSLDYKINCIGVQADISDKSSVVNLLNEINKNYRKIDILVNNAAIDDKIKDKTKKRTFEEYSVDDWKRIIDVNLTGQFLTSQIIGSKMALQRGGSIINILSIYGILSPDQRIYNSDDSKEFDFVKSPAYGASKAGLMNLTKYLATLWAEKGVRVNAITLGGIRYQQNEEFIKKYSSKVPMNRMGEKEEIRGALLLLASDMSSYITGANIIVDGGMSAW